MQTLTLGGDKFTVNPMASAWESFTLQPLMAPVLELFNEADKIPEILASLAGTDLAELDVMQVLPAVPPVARAVARALGKIPPPDLAAICKALFAVVIVEPNGASKGVVLADVFAILMRGRTLDTWRLLYACVRENYPDFFALLPARGGAQKAESPTAVSNT